MILAIGLVFCVLWSITPVRDYLIARHWIDEKTISGILGLLVAITIFELRRHEKTSKRLGDTLALFSPSQSSTILFGGVGEVYAKSSPLVKKVVLESKELTSIDVLRLTLYTSWPVALAPHIENGDIQRCTVNAYLLDPEFVKKNRDLFKEEWIAEVESKPAAIAAFVKEHKALLKRNQEVVNVKTYAFFPGVHGFRTSHGTFLISFVHWSKQKTLDEPNQSYEIFMSSYISARGNAYRTLLASTMPLRRTRRWGRSLKSEYCLGCGIHFHGLMCPWGHAGLTTGSTVVADASLVIVGAYEPPRNVARIDAHPRAWDIIVVGSVTGARSRVPRMTHYATTILAGALKLRRLLLILLALVTSPSARIQTLRSKEKG